MFALHRFVGLALVALFLAIAGGAQAQITEESRTYYQSWLDVAARAEKVVDVNRASNAALENLRAEIVSYREEFAKARDKNTSRIATLRSQLDALGPKPEDGVEEPEDIARLRFRLNEQVNALRVPRVLSGEAHNQANGLIREIDKIIRKDQTKRLLARGPSPLNPAHWPIAWQDIDHALTSLVNETRRNLRSAAIVEDIRQNLPVILLLSGLGLFFLLRGKYWAERLGEFLRRFGGRGTGVRGFVVSLTRVILPFLGTIILVQAVEMLGIWGLRGTLILAAIPGWALILLAFNWLSDQLYAKHRETSLLPAPKERRAEMRIYVDLVGVTIVLQEVINLYEKIERITDASRAVVAFPVILAAALLLLRLQRVGLSNRSEQSGEDMAALRRAGVYRIVRGIRRGAVMLALVSPLLAALGYGAAAEAIIYPVVLTVVVISAVLILQQFLGGLYVLLRRSNDTAARDSLFSVLVGWVLVLAALPVLALVWGARVADLTELWSMFLDGFQIGDARISPIGFLSFAAVFVVGYSVTRLLQGGLRTNLLPKTQIDPGGQNAIVAFTGYLGIFLAALVAVSSAGLDLSSVAIVAGALSVGIGFGLQTIVSNFVSGIILLIERPIAKGDWIEVGPFAGYVRDISVRSTRIETFDRADVIVPNTDLVSGTVINYTKGKTVGRVKVAVGVAYGTDTRMVEEILLDVANSHPMVLANPAPSVVFHGFGADALDFEIRAILRDVNWVLSVKSDMNHDIAKRFFEAGIEIPFAQRDIWLRNPEALFPKAATEARQTDTDPDDVVKST